MNIRLGDYDQSLPPKRTPLGILYFPYGLDDFGKNRIRKAVRKMTEAGVLEYIVNQFKEWATQLPVELPSWIDAAYTARLADWRRCIGRKLPNGVTITASKLDSITPDSFKIIFHPEPFQSRGGLTVDGLATPDKIEVVIADLSDGNTWLRRCDQLIEWEIGNMISMRCGYHTTPDKEIGNKNPCGI